MVTMFMLCKMIIVYYLTCHLYKVIHSTFSLLVSILLSVDMWLIMV